MRKYDNEEAMGSATIITLIFCFIFCGAMFAFISYPIDKITALANTMLYGVPIMQSTMTTMSWQLVIFRVSPFLMFMGLCINSVVNAMRTTSGNVDVGGMLMAGGETIILIFVLICLNLIGGYSLSLVIGFVSRMQFVPLPEHYEVIQILPEFFGWMCMILTIACVAIFIVKCVSDVSYASQYEL